MSNKMDEMRFFYSTLSEGEKIYLANKLWKEDRIAAQKLLHYIPEEETRKLDYNKGDKILVEVEVVGTDVKDLGLPYQVAYLDSTTNWISSEDIRGKVK